MKVQLINPIKSAIHAKAFEGRAVIDKASALRDGFKPLTNAFYQGEESMLRAVIAEQVKAEAIFCLVTSDGGICVYRKEMKTGDEGLK
jgi:hypothetical protein